MRNQLLILLTTLQSKPLLMISSILSFFMPIANILILVGCAIVLDTFTGLWKSIKVGNKVTSRKLSSVISKMLLYQSTVLLFYMLDVFILNEIVIAFFNVPLLTTKILGLTLVSVEIVSINENYKKVMNVDLWSSLKNMLSRAKEIKKDISKVNEKNR